MDEYDHLKLAEFREKVLTRDDSKLKPEYANLTEKLDVWVKYVLSRIHDKFMWLDMPHMINKEAIRVVTGLSSTGPVLTLKAVKN